MRWESVIIALFGTLLGLVIGLFFGWAVVRALKERRLHRVRGRARSARVVVVLAAVVGIVAAWLPARRAAKLDILDASPPSSTTT